MRKSLVFVVSFLYTVLVITSAVAETTVVHNSMDISGKDIVNWVCGALGFFVLWTFNRVWRVLDSVSKEISGMKAELKTLKGTCEERGKHCGAHHV